MLLEDENIFALFPYFFALMPEYVNKHIDTYTFDEICYFCRVAHIHIGALENHDTISFWSNLHQMIEHIKTASFSRGFKIDVHSNFHKLLQIIDMAEFFGGGENK
jgi:hypothetical protein